ncbi:MAG: histidine kinase [Chitinophagaceae bacterium]|nr:histidine kinase [Chitinophagaceae bacterium]MBN8667174.1 histidine kinase [Chitinophagales bacterium]
MRLLFIPLLGVFIPILSGIVTYNKYTWPVLIAANAYFIFTSLCIWRGSQWTHLKTRHLFNKGWNPLPKVVSLSILTSLCGVAVGGFFVILWFYISKETFSWALVYKFLFITSLAVILFTLIYEILYLTKEREVDNQIVDQLDQERTNAELEALRNELDPHFIFNSLNTLNHLILHNPLQAHSFNNKLAQVYKYFLINRHKQLVSLPDELEFMENYFYLLQIRHDDKLNISLDIKPPDSNVLIPPCALQILLENAIKHNSFTTAEPLTIRIQQNGQSLKVSNDVKPKPYPAHSTGIGLKNLSSRYRILCKKDIKVERSGSVFSVRLPLITNP